MSGALPSPNTSATGGYLTPISPIDDGDGFTDLLQGAVAGCTGLPGSLVRPRWQPDPPEQPEPNTNWAAVGITRQVTDDYPVEIHTGATGMDPLTAFSAVAVHQTIELTASFYGPAAKLNAETCRLGFYLTQNRAILEGRGVRLLDASEIVQIPELVNTQYINRCDLKIRLRRQLNVTYRILDLASAPGTVTDDTGFVDPIDTAPEGLVI